MRLDGLSNSEIISTDSAPTEAEINLFLCKVDQIIMSELHEKTTKLVRACDANGVAALTQLAKRDIAIINYLRELSVNR